MPGHLIHYGSGVAPWQAFKGTLYILQKSCATESLGSSSYLMKKYLSVHFSKEEAYYFAEKNTDAVLFEVPGMDLPSSGVMAMHKLSEAVSAITAKHPQNYEYLGTDRSTNEYSKGRPKEGGPDVTEYYRTLKGKVVKVTSEVKGQFFSKHIHRDAAAFSKRVLKDDGRDKFYGKTVYRANKKTSQDLYKGTKKTGQKIPSEINSEEKKLSYLTQWKKTMENLAKDSGGLASILNKGGASIMDLNEVEFGLAPGRAHFSRMLEDRSNPGQPSPDLDAVG